MTTSPLALTPRPFARRGLANSAVRLCELRKLAPVPVIAA